MADYMWTGGYQWREGSRLKGDPNAVAAALNVIKDRHGRADVDRVYEAWERGDKALRETMGDEEAVQRIGAEHMIYQIFGGLEYEKVHVRTEETAPGGRVFQPLAKVTGNADNVRVFVETPREAILLGSSYRPPVSQPATTTARPTAPAQPRPAPLPVLTMADVAPRPTPPIVPDREMEAWVALCAWRDRYGDIPLYQPIIDAMDALKG